MAKLGMGVVGVGTMGRQHAQNIRCLIPEANLIAIADADVKRAEQVAAELEVPHFYGSVEALVENPAIKAVVIVTPAKFHGAAIRVCAQAGKDVFCEKPFTLTLPEADEVLDLTAKAGVRVQLGHVRRYAPPTCAPGSESRPARLATRCCSNRWRAIPRLRPSATWPAASMACSSRTPPCTSLTSAAG